MKAKKIGAILLASVMAVSMVPAMKCQCSRCKESMFCCKSKFRYLCGMAYN